MTTETQPSAKRALGANISIFAALIALGACAYYCISAPAANVFDTAVVVAYAVAIVCALVYALAPTKWVDILNLAAVVCLTYAILSVAIGSIGTFADVLSGITMFGSTGGIEWIIAVLAISGVALLLEVLSCFMCRRKQA